MGIVVHILYSYDLLRPYIELLHELRVEFIDDPKINTFIPEEFHQPYLAQDANHLCLIVGDKDAVDTTAKYFYSPGQVLVAL
ncbi:hypothetical protein RRF57_001201 [Xylaria bambusicola]|uniref:Uncharacterized protein n=1 Tax=Xylaria bambusicola TaxID=326684 RepID=A0AAN7U4L1_9PEZI